MQWAGGVEVVGGEFVGAGPFGEPVLENPLVRDGEHQGEEEGLSHLARGGPGLAVVDVDVEGAALEAAVGAFVTESGPCGTNCR